MIRIVVNKNSKINLFDDDFERIKDILFDWWLNKKYEDSFCVIYEKGGLSEQ